MKRILFVTALMVAQLGCSGGSTNNGTPIPGPTALAINVPIPTLAVGASETLVASGGTAPYAYYRVSGVGNIDQASGVYSSQTAGTAQVAVVDAIRNVAYATITVSNSTSACATLAISPATVTVNTGASYTLTACGGTPPYFYSVVSGVGQIDLNTGTYSALASTGSAEIKVVDSSSPANFAFASITVSDATTTTSGNLVEIYRFYSPGATDHLYSLSPTEGQPFGFNFEGPSFRVFSDSNISGTIALWRCRTTTIPQRHFLSGNANCDGKIQESILGYIYPSPVNGLQALFRFVSSNGLDHLETLSFNEGNSAGYLFESIPGYVFGP